MYLRFLCPIAAPVHVGWKLWRVWVSDPDVVFSRRSLWWITRYDNTNINTSADGNAVLTDWTLSNTAATNTVALVLPSTSVWFYRLHLYGSTVLICLFLSSTSVWFYRLHLSGSSVYICLDLPSTSVWFYCLHLSGSTVYICLVRLSTSVWFYRLHLSGCTVYICLVLPSTSVWF